LVNINIYLIININLNIYLNLLSKHILIENIVGFKKDVFPLNIYLPELKSIKKITTAEIIASISRLADPQMLFINMTKKNANDNLISGIVYLPYNPNIIDSNYINPEFILNICKYLKLNSK